MSYLDTLHRTTFPIDSDYHSMDTVGRGSAMSIQTRHMIDFVARTNEKKGSVFVIPLTNLLSSSKLMTTLHLLFCLVRSADKLNFTRQSASMSSITRDFRFVIYFLFYSLSLTSNMMSSRDRRTQ